MVTYALELDRIDFGFAIGQGLFFHGLSARFPTGAVHFVRGQNGAGKSTLFNVVRGIVNAHEQFAGTITVHGKAFTCGRDQRSDLRPLQQEIKLVPQNFDVALADQLTFTDNLRVAKMGRYPDLAPVPVLSALPALVERFGIPHNKPVCQLSGGQRQMLAILMALQKSTKILLLDEPTAALDPHNAAMVMDFLQSLVADSNLTVLMISHDLELFNRYAGAQYYNLAVDEQTKVRRLELVQK
jgi:ABC-type multidrug transport system ATPase subunit